MEDASTNVASARWLKRSCLHILAIDTIYDLKKHYLTGLIGNLLIKLYVCTDPMRAVAPRQIEPSGQVSPIAIATNSKIFDRLVKFPISSHRRTVTA
jgi:hypothetical protein